MKRKSFAASVVQRWWSRMKYKRILRQNKAAKRTIKMCVRIYWRVLQVHKRRKAVSQISVIYFIILIFIYFSLFIK